MKDFLSLFLVCASIGSCASLSTGPMRASKAFQERIYSNWTVLHPNVLTPLANPTALRDATCGNKNQSPTILAGRIAGGTVATPNEYPWQAFLQIYSGQSSTTYYICSGTLISNEWILSSANCLDGALYIKVYLGAHDMTATNEWQRIMFTTTEYKKHQNWNPQTLNGDIALIKLPVPVTFNSFIRPICLPSSNDPSHNGDIVYLTGWGRTSGSGMAGPLSPVLKETTSTVISNSECYAVYGNVVTDNIICSSGAGGRGICPSDNGGPMGYINADGTMIQIGVASFFSSAGCENGQPSGFTRMRSYLSWISKETGNAIPNAAGTVFDSLYLNLIFVLTVIIQRNIFH